METSTEIFGSILSNGTMSGIGGKLQREVWMNRYLQIEK